MLWDGVEGYGGYLNEFAKFLDRKCGLEEGQ